MKRNTLKTVIITLVVVALIGVGIYFTLLPKEYKTANVSKSDIQEIISETGSIVSNKEKTYFAENDIIIKNVSLKAGHRVSKDSELMKYTKVSDPNGEEFTLTAEFSGVVTETLVKEGATIAQGSTLFTIADDSDICAVIELASEVLENVEKGQKANIKCGDQTYEGSVSDLHQLAIKTDGKPKVNVEIHINNDDREIYLGSEVKVDIFAAARDSVMVVPIESVYSDADNDYVYSIENNIIVKKSVKLGISSDKYTEIKEGLSTSDVVITENVSDADRGKKARSK